MSYRACAEYVWNLAHESMASEKLENFEVKNGKHAEISNIGKYVDIESIRNQGKVPTAGEIMMQTKYAYLSTPAAQDKSAENSDVMEVPEIKRNLPNETAESVEAVQKLYDEALMNMIRHANAIFVKIRVATDDLADKAMLGRILRAVHDHAKEGQLVTIPGQTLSTDPLPITYSELPWEMKVFVDTQTKPLHAKIAELEAKLAELEELNASLAGTKEYEMFWRNAWSDAQLKLDELKK